MKCPICQASTRPRAENRFHPFCSQRCQLVDLGRWLDGDYRIPGEPVDDVVAIPDAEDASYDARGNGARRDGARHDGGRGDGNDDDLRH